MNGGMSTTTDRADIGGVLRRVAGEGQVIPVGGLLGELQLLFVAHTLGNVDDGAYNQFAGMGFDPV